MQTKKEGFCSHSADWEAFALRKCERKMPVLASHSTCVDFVGFALTPKRLESGSWVIGGSCLAQS